MWCHVEILLQTYYLSTDYFSPVLLRPVPPAVARIYLNHRFVVWVCSIFMQLLSCDCTILTDACFTVAATWAPSFGGFALAMDAPVMFNKLFSSGDAVCVPACSVSTRVIPMTVGVKPSRLASLYVPRGLVLSLVVLSSESSAHSVLLYVMYTYENT